MRNSRLARKDLEEVFRACTRGDSGRISQRLGDRPWRYMFGDEYEIWTVSRWEVIKNP